jgi:hypothetical protein
MVIYKVKRSLPRRRFSIEVRASLLFSLVVLTTHGEKEGGKKVRTWRKEISWKGRVLIIHSCRGLFLFLFIVATQCEGKLPPCERGLLIALNESAAQQLLLFSHCSKRRRRRRRSSSFRPSSLRCSARPRRWRHWRTPALLISVVLVRFSWLF